MKSKALKRSSSNSVIRREKKKKIGIHKGSLSRHLTMEQLGQTLLLAPQQQQSSSFNLSKPSRFQSLIESEADPAAAAAPESHLPSSSPLDSDDNQHFILSQDFFCTPDYITPNEPPLPNNFDWNKENNPCPKSPEKKATVKCKRQRQFFSDGSLANFTTSEFSCDQTSMEVADDISVAHEIKTEKATETESQKNGGYISQSAVALRCRVMPPPCMKNPYLKDPTDFDIDPFGSCRSKIEGLFPAAFGGSGLSRYRMDFHEVEQIGSGNFSRVFKVLNRIDGCMYAVKHSTRQLHLDTERRKALMEVQALAALGYHENVVGYNTSWFENEKLYIQMELCDCSLSISRSSKLFTEAEALEVMHQIGKALQYIHDRGVAHLDVKPDNIYVKNGIYKLGDFGCATLIDTSLPIEEGDARYMPQEILNEKYDHLDKVDVFSLGASIFELVRGSTLPDSGPHLLNLREGKLPLLPSHSVQFQNLLKAMMDPDPVRRPSAKELVGNQVFDRTHRASKTKAILTSTFC